MTVFLLIAFPRSGEFDTSNWFFESSVSIPGRAELAYARTRCHRRNDDDDDDDVETNTL